MTRKRSWSAYAVLAICGAPIFTIAAWKIVHDTPVESLVIELDAEGNATITANRRWTSDVRTGFRLREKRSRLNDVMKAFALEAKRRPNGLPICPVVIAVSGDTPVRLVSDVLVTTIRNSLSDLTLDANDTRAAFHWAVPDNRPVPALLPESDIALAGLRLRTDNRGWEVEAVRSKRGSADPMPLPSPSDPKPIHDGSAQAVIPETFRHEIIVPLDEPDVGFVSPDAWRELVKLAGRRDTIPLACPEDAELSGMNGVCLLMAGDARSGDLVRALAFLVSHEGLKVYIVWPEREGARDWRLAP